MKTVLFWLIIAGIANSISAQSLETVTLQINDLEENRDRLEQQILDINSTLEELYKQKHDLTVVTLSGGHPAQNAGEIKLYDKPGSFSVKVLATIPKQTKLLIEEIELLSYCKTNFGGLTGYVRVYEITFENPDSWDILKKESYAVAQIKAAKKEEENRIANAAKREESQLAFQKIRNEQEAKAKKAREARAQEIRAKYPEETAILLINREVWIGMTKEMMIDSRGYPKDINRSVGSWGVHEQCIYDYIYIYIENGKVTSWQD